MLFEVKPHTQITRTYKRFSGVMGMRINKYPVRIAIFLPLYLSYVSTESISVQLLQKFSVTASGTGEKLTRVIRNPVTQYFPVNSRRIGAGLSLELLFSLTNRGFSFLNLTNALL